MERAPGMTREHLEGLSDEELGAWYEKLVGVNPKFRSLTRERLIAAVLDPEEEHARLLAEDKESDNEELRRQNPGWGRKK